MQADPNAQRALLDIAKLDQRAAKLKYDVQSLPQIAQLAELSKQRNQLLEQLVEAETKVGDAQLDVDQIQEDLDTATARRERNQKTIDEGSVAAKTLSSLIEETEHLKGRIVKLEDSQLEAMDVLDQLTGIKDQIEAKRVELETKMRELIAERDAAGEKLKSEYLQVQADRSQRTRVLPDDLLQLYDKIVERAGTSGAAELRAGRCGGCGIHLDAAELQRHRDAKPSDVLRCEECGRILVRTSESGL